MTSIRTPKRRPIFLETLEDRLVLSSSAAAAAFATENAQLTQLNSGLNPAYNSFASAIFQAEFAFFNATAGAPAGTTTSPTAALATLEGVITTQISTLESAILPTLASLPGSTTNLSTQIDAQLSGPSPGSFANEMTSLLNAASFGTSDGSVPQSLFPILFQAVNNAVSGSYSSTAVDEYYFVTGQAFNSSGNIISNTGNNTLSSFNLSTVATAQNAAWTTAATSIFQAESSLINPAGSTTGSPITTGATVTTEVTKAVSTLEQAIVSSLASTPASNNTGALSSLLTGSVPGSLTSQLTSLLSTASTDSDGSVPQASLPLLFTAIDDAIEASYNGTAVSSFLLAVSPVYLPGGAGTAPGSSTVA
jgi:hypothetical protein